MQHVSYIAAGRQFRSPKRKKRHALQHAHSWHSGSAPDCRDDLYTLSEKTSSSRAGVEFLPTDFRIALRSVNALSADFGSKETSSSGTRFTDVQACRDRPRSKIWVAPAFSVRNPLSLETTLIRGPSTAANPDCVRLVARKKDQSPCAFRSKFPAHHL